MTSVTGTNGSAAERTGYREENGGPWDQIQGLSMAATFAALTTNLP